MTSQLSVADEFIARWNGRVPIVLGVTGHRNIDTQHPVVRAAIREQCLAMSRWYPSTPFIILSGMAEGADRLVASIAMETIGAALIALLPMPREEYEKDFTDQASLAEFRDLLARAFSVSEVHVPGDKEDWKSPGEARNEQYARAGAIVADHAQILFALWDGKGARGTGGTAEIVAWFDRGFAPACYSLYEDALSPLDPPDPGRRIHIDPDSGAVSFVEAGGAATLVPVRKSSRIEAILRRTEAYNSDILRHPAAIACSYPLAPADVVEKGPAKFSVGAYHTADGLSIHYAHTVRTTDRLVYAFALGAFFVFNLVDRVPAASWAYLGITAIMLVLAGGVWLRSADNSFLEYRSLAEAMRVMFFWRLAGVQRPVWLSYLSRHSGVVHWIRHAVRSLEFCQDCLLLRDNAVGGYTAAERVAVAREHWITDQKNWFTKKEALHRKHYWRWKRVARIAIATSFVFAGFLAILAVYHRTNLVQWDTIVDPFSNYFQIVLGMLAASGLAARGFLARRADFELAKQYGSQQRIFTVAEKTLEACQKAEPTEWTPTQILERLGDEALQEQAEWLWLRHSRPFEIPK